MKIPTPIRILKDEHAMIRRGLEGLRAKGSWREFFDYALTQVLSGHERREELTLFRYLSTKAEIRSGGPMCVLYYDLYLADSPMAKAARACGESTQDPSKTLPAEDFRREYFEKSSPICLPITDHLSMEQMIRRSTSLQDKESLEKLAFAYLNLLHHHFEKEENCLFPMAQQLLSSEEWAQLEFELQNYRDAATRL